MNESIPTYQKFNVTINVLGRTARTIISTLLNPTTYIPTKENLQRDWTGLADLLGYNSEDISYFRSTSDPASFILQKWSSCEDSTIAKLLCCLQKLDRFDVIVDTFDIIISDISSHERGRVNNIDTSLFITNKDHECYRRGLPPIQYHASILYASEDVDFAGELVQKLESQCHLNIFVPERDLIAGIIQHNATMQIIAGRCNKLIAVLSPSFLNSPVNQYFLSFAQSIGIDQQERKIIPCIYKECDIPPELRQLHMLVYRPVGALYNFYGKLQEALQRGIPSASEKALTAPPIRAISVPNQPLTRAVTKKPSLCNIVEANADVRTKEENSKKKKRPLWPKFRTPSIFKKRDKVPA